MIKHTEVMKLALEALTKNSDRVTEIRAKDQAITALREALTSVPDWASEAKEQPAPATELREQEPGVAVFELQESGWEIICDGDWIQTLPLRTKLYTSPQPAQLSKLTGVKPWVGLTDEDKAEIKKQANYNWETTAGEYASKVQALTEAKLRERNT